ncbi:MAG: flagellar hook capping FlgD N-terminal domain-containing protein [Pseudomonadota bacterium]|uniref:flagellar hook assembly protein FlgD n=1 Tax=Thalassovita sp. TaxID=1979401 RepID=UPI002AAFC2C9|nr:flagellar hook capping FlgD N-terminal domain-containing protein [Thalassovita sp.]MEC8040961.1 flagellar hook capping FlgD N-terminal domain-containing protein [Pseudomonadota bacterium]MEC8295882.1 flagellar hook capping FlgD N-terminal domain-containing protein [Pseudomonadota bacterium]
MTVNSVSGSSGGGIRTLEDMNASQRVADSDTELNSDDFLMLLTTQLQNQDPLSPMQNEQFLAQLAQMSSVSGIENLNTTMTSVASAMSNTMISEASSMLGQKALVNGSTTRANDGEVHGRVFVPDNGSDVTITITDANTGEILHSQVKTDQYAGPVEFSWEDAPSDGREIRISSSISNQGGTQDATVGVYALIEGVEIDPNSNEMILQVQDYGMYLGSEITALR